MNERRIDAGDDHEHGAEAAPHKTDRRLNFKAVKEFFKDLIVRATSTK